MLILLDFFAWPDFIRFLRRSIVPLVVLVRALVLLVRAGLAAISQWVQRAIVGSQPSGSGPAILRQAGVLRLDYVVAS